jgi:hypothetical protein
VKLLTVNYPSLLGDYEVALEPVPRQFPLLAQDLDLRKILFPTLLLLNLQFHFLVRKRIGALLLLQWEGVQC